METRCQKQRTPSTFFQDANYHNQIVKDRTEEAGTISAGRKRVFSASPENLPRRISFARPVRSDSLRCPLTFLLATRAEGKRQGERRRGKGIEPRAAGQAVVKFPEKMARKPRQQRIDTPQEATPSVQDGS
jgi:hypothetical protein